MTCYPIAVPSEEFSYDTIQDFINNFNLKEWGIEEFDPDLVTLRNDYSDLYHVARSCIIEKARWVDPSTRITYRLREIDNILYAVDERGL